MKEEKGHVVDDITCVVAFLPFLELQPPSKRHLMVQLAERLHAHGLSTQAGQLRSSRSLWEVSARLTAQIRSHRSLQS